MTDMKKSVFVLCLTVFIAVSFVYITPEARQVRSSYHSSQLRKVISRDQNTVRTDYVDADGSIAIAANLGYATLIVTDLGDSALERYYDAQGDPIPTYLHYYGLLREYDGNGNSRRITYLGLDGKPVMIWGGYAIEERDFNQEGYPVRVRYFDADGLPAPSSMYGYERVNTFDADGNLIRISCTDPSGSLMMTAYGYAEIVRNLYGPQEPDHGRVESEFYFDDAGDPVSLSLGQYGVHKEYDENGWERVLTYLDAEGHPIITSKGYTSVVRTFYADSTIETERYYDLEGNPFALAEGRYGIRTDAGQTSYLNEDGNEIFNLKTFLYNQSWAVIVCALAAVILSAAAGRKGNVFFLIVYLSAIVYLTLMFRENGTGKRIFVPFSSYGKILTDSEARADIIKNIWLFIPFGTILYRLCPKKAVLLIPVVFSVLIEAFQFFSGIGFCEADDVISNGMGGLIGWEAGRLINDLTLGCFMKKKKTLNTENAVEKE